MEEALGPETPVASGCRWQELSQAGMGVAGCVHIEALAQRSHEASQPVVGFGFGNRDRSADEQTRLEPEEEVGCRELT